MNFQTIYSEGLLISADLVAQIQTDKLDINLIFPYHISKELDSLPEVNLCRLPKLHPKDK